MKVIIAGGRDFNDYELLKKYANHYLSSQIEIEIVSGTANGVDKLGERYANENNYLLTQFPADWNKNGKSAGYVRNSEMAKYGDALIAFWNGNSKGTKHMIDIAINLNLKVKVVRY